MKKWLIGSLILILVISGCNLVGGPQQPERTAGLADFVRSGTSGLRVTFIEGLPPRAMYDTSDLVIVNELKNEGSYDIDANKCFLELSGR